MKSTVGRLIGVRDVHLTGHQDDFDAGPTLMHGMGELQPIDAAGHLDIGKQQVDVRTCFENGQRLIGVDGLDRGKSGILDDIHGAHAQHHLVFNDEHVRWTRCHSAS